MARIGAALASYSVESISWLGDDDNLQARTREALDVQTGSALERFGSNINEFATYVAVERGIAHEAVARLNSGRIKGRAVKARLLTDA